MSSSGASCFPIIYWSTRATGNPDFLLFLWPKGVQKFKKNWVNKVKSKIDPERPIKSTKTIYILTCEHALMGFTVRFLRWLSLWLLWFYKKLMMKVLKMGNKILVCSVVWCLPVWKPTIKESSKWDHHSSPVGDVSPPLIKIMWSGTIKLSWKALVSGCLVLIYANITATFFME